MYSWIGENFLQFCKSVDINIANSQVPARSRRDVEPRLNRYRKINTLTKTLSASIEAKIKFMPCSISENFSHANSGSRINLKLEDLRVHLTSAKMGQMALSPISSLGYYCHVFAFRPSKLSIQSSL